MKHAYNPTNGFALGNNARAGFGEANQLIGLDNDQAFGSNARACGSVHPWRLVIMQRRLKVVLLLWVTALNLAVSRA